MRYSILLLNLLAILPMFHNLQAQNSSNPRKMLVAYFSHSGNTKVVALKIQKATGADIFEIKPVKDYPANYNAVVEQAKKEINTNFKPALKRKVSDFSQYNMIFIGSPNWWTTIAPPVSTFLSSYNFEGKTIVPFITNEGSGFGNAISDIKKLCPKSIILEGIAIRGSNVQSANADVKNWLKKIKLIK